MPNVTLTDEQIIGGLHSGNFLAPAQFTFSIANGASTWSHYAPGEEPSDPAYAILTATQAAAFRAAIAAWDNLIALNFTEVTETASTWGEIRVAFTSMDAQTAGYAYQGNIKTPTSKVADIWLNETTAGQEFGVGTDGYNTLLHEIGHALGLSHSFAEGGDTTVIPALYENERYTVMSYTGISPVFSIGFNFPTPNNIEVTSQRVIVTSPMVLDIAAIQLLYGAETTTASGDTVYAFAQGDTSVQSIYDAGGIDTINLSSFTRNNVLDLTPGGYSSMGLWTEAEQTAYWQAQTPHQSFKDFIAQQYTNNDAYEWRDNLGIALSTTIENAWLGSGNDIVIGNAVANQFRLQTGGDDNVSGGAGSDGFFFGAALTAADIVNGGESFGDDDQIALQGSYGALTLLSTHLDGIETVALLAGTDTRFGAPGNQSHSYNLTIGAGAVDAGQNLTINANDLGAGESLTVNLSAIGDASVRVFSGMGSTTLTGTDGDDGFFFGQDGRFSVDDVIIGGAGTDDQLGLRGDYSTLMIFENDTISGIETIALISASDTRFASGGGPFSYNLRSHDGNLGLNAQLIVNGTGLQANESLQFDGSLETDGFFDLRGGAGADTLRGGSGNDSLYGGLGQDQLYGNGGADTFVFRSVSDSLVLTRDVIDNFVSGSDKIDLSFLDANSNTGANDAFSFIGGATFGNVAGQLRYDAATGLLEGDVNGDSTADFAILLSNQPAVIVATDFVL